MRTMHAGFVVALWALAPSAAAAQSPQPVGGLSIEQLIAMALDKHPSLAEARAMIAAAEGRRAQARLRPNPTVSAMLRREVGGMDRMTDASATLPLELFRRGPRVAMAEAAVGEAAAEARRTMLASELEVRRAYGAVLAARRRAEIAREIEATARTTFELVDASAKEGVAPEIERDLARVELDRMSARRQFAEAERDAAAAGLFAAVGVPGVDAAGTLEAAVVAQAVDAIAAHDPAAITDHPDVVAAEARVRGREAEIVQLRSEGGWDMSLSAGYVRMRSGFPFEAFDGVGQLRGIEATFHNVSASAMVMVPLFNRNQGAVAAGVAERDAARASAAAAAIAVEAERSRTRVELRAALDIAARYRKTIVPQAVRNLDTITKRYGLGRGTLFDVLQARQQLLQIQDEYTDALRRAYDAHVAAIGARGGAR